MGSGKNESPAPPSNCFSLCPRSQVSKKKLLGMLGTVLMVHDCTARVRHLSAKPLGSKFEPRGFADQCLMRATTYSLVCFARRLEATGGLGASPRSQGLGTWVHCPVCVSSSFFQLLLGIDFTTGCVCLVIFSPSGRVQQRED